MSEIINETINELNKPTQNNIFSIEDNPVTVLEKINQITRYLKQIDNSVDTSFNNSIEAKQLANDAKNRINDFVRQENKTNVTLNNNPLATWKADFAESERQKSKNLFYIPNDYTNTLSGVVLNYLTNTQTITLNGTGTGQNGFNVNVKPIVLKANKAYTFSVVKKGTLSGENVYLYFKTSANAWGHFIILNSSSSYTFTPTSNETLQTINISFDQNRVFTNYELNIQLEEGTQATEWQAYNGAIVNEKQLSNYEIISGLNTISINSSSLTSLLEYIKYFNSYDSTFRVDIGNLETSNFKDLVGNPSGFSNYTSCYISKKLIDKINNRYVYELQAVGAIVGKYAIGYIYQVSGVAYFTGWTVLN